MRSRSTAVKVFPWIQFFQFSSLCRPQYVFLNRKLFKPISLWQNTLIECSCWLIHLQYFLNDIKTTSTYKLHSQHFTFQWKLLVIIIDGYVVKLRLNVELHTTHSLSEMYGGINKGQFRLVGFGGGPWENNWLKNGGGRGRTTKLDSNWISDVN